MTEDGEGFAIEGWGLGIGGGSGCIVREGWDG